MSQIHSSRKATPSIVNKLQRSAQFHASDIAAPPHSTKTQIKSIKTTIDKSVFLKTKPQLLILMQQAEIQRLTDYLNDYKCKYNQLIRQNLDRESYQTQIKQLFQKQGYNSSQNQKLNRTVQNLINISQSYRSQLFTASEQKHSLMIRTSQLQQSNAELLKQVQTISENRLKQRKRSEEQKMILNNEIISIKTYVQSLEINNSVLIKQIKDAQQKLNKLFQIQAQYKHSSEYIKSLNKQISLKSSSYINQSRDHEQLLNSYNKINQAHSKVNAQVSSLKQLLQQLTIENQYLLRAKQQSQNALQIAREAYQKDKFLLQNQISDMQTIRKLNEGELASKDRQIQELSDKYNNHLQNLKTVKLDNIKNSKEKDDIQRQRMGLHHAVENLQDKLGSSLTQLSQLRTQLINKNSQLQIAKKDLERLKDLEEQLTKEKAKNQKQLGQLSKVMTNKIKQNQSLKLKLISQQQQMIQHFQQNLAHFTTTYDAKIKKITDDQQNLEVNNNKLTEEKQKLILLIKSLAKDNTEAKKMTQKLQLEKGQLASIKDELLLERNKLQEANQLLINKNQLQASRLDELKQLKNSCLLLQSKKGQLQKRVKILQISNEERQNNIQVLQRSISQLHQSIQYKNRQKIELHNNWSKTLTQYQTLKKDIEIAKQQKAKMSQIIAFYKHETSQLQKIIAELSQQKQKQKIAKSQLKSQMSEKVQQKAQILQRFQKLKEQNDKNELKMKDIQNRMIEMTIQKNNLWSDNERLKNIQKQLMQQRSMLTMLLQNKTKQGEKLKAKLIDLEVQLRSTYDNYLKDRQTKYLSQLKTKDNQKLQLSTMIYKLNEQSLKWKQQQQIKQKQLLKSISQMTAQSQREKSSIQSLKKQYELLKSSYNSLQQRYKTAQLNFGVKSQQFQIQKQNLIKMSQQKVRDIDQMKRTIQYYDQRLTSLSKQLQRLQSIIIKNNSDFKSQMDNMKIARNDLQKNNSIKKAQIEAKRLKIIELQQQNRTIVTRVSYYQDILLKLKQQVISLQLATTSLQKQRDALLQKNNYLMRSIKRFSEELLAGQTIQKVAQGGQSPFNEQLNKTYNRIYTILNMSKRSQLEFNQNSIIQNRRIISQ